MFAALGIEPVTADQVAVRIEITEERTWQDRFPGIALFKVPYADVGNVKMCATAALNNILLIETDKEKYGITPADEESFVAALRAQMEG